MSIDVLLTQASTLIRTVADVATLRQLILTLAVQGKLVPQDGRNIVPLKQLTTKIGSGATPQGGKEIYQDSGIPAQYVR
jgi:hypothetical protein